MHYLQKNGSYENLIDWNLTTWLAIGSATGGIVGQNIYAGIQSIFVNKEIVGGYKAIALFLSMVFVLLYSLHKSKVKSYKVTNPILLSNSIRVYTGVFCNFCWYWWRGFEFSFSLFFSIYVNQSCSTNFFIFDTYFSNFRVSNDIFYWGYPSRNISWGY